jgi:hypothetical protein
MELLSQVPSSSSIALNITVEWAAILFRIKENTVSNLASETGHILTDVICDFPQSLQVYGVDIAMGWMVGV